MSKRKLSLRERVLMELNNTFSKVVNVNFETDLRGSIISQGSEKAINSYDNDREEVMATSWFDNNYCFFIRIDVLSEKKNEQVFASVSFFQATDNGLKQLFRAEWDSYPKSDNYSHPQPHWHFTAQLSDKTSFSELEDEEDENIYSALEGNAKTINLDRMHFAMAGGWIEDGDMLGELKDESVLVRWLLHLFTHVRAELAYKERV